MWLFGKILLFKGILSMTPWQRNSQQCCHRNRQSNAILYVVPQTHKTFAQNFQRHCAGFTFWHKCPDCCESFAEKSGMWDFTFRRLKRLKTRHGFNSCGFNGFLRPKPPKFKSKLPVGLSVWPGRRSLEHVKHDEWFLSKLHTLSIRNHWWIDEL